MIPTSALPLPAVHIRDNQGNIVLTQIIIPNEMENWGEDVRGPVSAKSMATIQAFLDVAPNVTSWILLYSKEIPDAHEFTLPSADGTRFIFRIWQFGAGQEGHAEVDTYIMVGSGSQGLSVCGQKIAWIGGIRGQLVAVTTWGVMFRITRERSTTVENNTGIWQHSEVKGFRIEMTSMRDPNNHFARELPEHLRL